MATTAPGSNLASLPSAGSAAYSRSAPLVTAARPRRLSPEVGRAIEMLGHAIEYLADEFALDCLESRAAQRGGVHPRIVAIELLMERNREIYLSCPPMPTLTERFRSLIGIRASNSGACTK